VERETPMGMGIRVAHSNQNADRTLSDLLEAAMSRVYAEPAQALPLLQRVIALAREGRDERSLGLALLNAGFAAKASSEHVVALEYLSEGLQVFMTLDDPINEVSCRINLGLVYERCGDYEAALEQLELALDRSNGNLRGRSMAVFYIAQVAAKLGDLEKALRYGWESHEAAQMLAEPIGVGWTRELLGTVLFARSRTLGHGEYDQALSHLQAALEVARTHHVQELLGETQAKLSQVYAALGDPARALESNAAALQTSRELGDRKLEAECLIARTAWQPDPSAASADLIRALRLAHVLANHDLIAQVHLEASGLAERQGEFRTALERHRLFHEHQAMQNRDAAGRRAQLVNARLGLERALMESEIHRRKGEELENMVFERTVQLENNQIETLDLLATIGEFRDEDTSHHTNRVGVWSARVAEELGWQEFEVALITQAAKLHDIGKIAISDTILLKPGKLTAEEFDEMKAHTTRGARMLERGTSAVLRMAQEIVLSHHERWDGRGYPHGLSGTDIPVAARIVSVVDVFDALTSERPYKSAWTVPDALAELERNAGTQFDAAVVAAFKQVVRHSTLSP
jgi:HD-GYP domain-containing protein (c-di-GMP phosphodiesterase class II)